MPKQAAASSARGGVKRAMKPMKTMKAMKAKTPMKAMKDLKVMKATTPMKAMKAMKAMKDDGTWKVKDCANLRMARLPECELKRRFSESMDEAYMDYQELVHYNKSFREPPPCTWRAFWPDRLRESGWLQVTKKVLASHEGWVLLEEEEDDDDE